VKSTAVPCRVLANPVLLNHDTPVTNATNKHHAWLIVPLLFAATCAVLAVAVHTDNWATWFAHPARRPLPEVTRQGAQLLRIMLVVAAVSLIAFPLALTRLELRGKPLDKQPHKSSSTDLWLVTGLIVLGILLRASRLGESLWYDEIAAWLSFGIHGPGPIIGNFFEPSNHVAHTLLSWCAVHWTESMLRFEIALRLPALLFSLGAIVGMYALARRTLNRRAAVLAGLLMAVLPVAVLEGVEARGYSMMICFSAWATWLLVATRTNDRAWLWCAYAGVCALGVWTHFVTAFVPIGHAVWFLWRATRHKERAWAVRGALALIFAAVLAITLYAPAIPDLLNVREIYVASGGDEPGLLGPEGWHALLQLGGSWYAWAAWAGLIALLVGLACSPPTPKNDSRPLLREVGVIAMLGLPLMALAVPLLGSWMYARFALFSLPGAVLLMAGGIDCLWHKKRIAALLLLLVIVATSAADLAVRPAKQPLRDAAEYVIQQHNDGDSILVIGLAHRVMDLYLFDPPPTYSLGHGADLPQKLNDVNPQWIILYYPNHLSADHAALLQQRGYESVQHFRGWVDWNNGDVEVYARAAAKPDN